MTNKEPTEKDIQSILNDKCLKSSSRLLILVCLSMNEKLGFTELSKLTGLSKGSLGNHLIRLETSNYISVKRYSFFSSRRITVRITQEGRQAANTYIRVINHLSSKVEKQDKTQDFHEESVD